MAVQEGGPRHPADSQIRKVELVPVREIGTGNITDFVRLVRLERKRPDIPDATESTEQNATQGGISPVPDEATGSRKFTGPSLPDVPKPPSLLGIFDEQTEGAPNLKTTQG